MVLRAPPTLREWDYPPTRCLRCPHNKEHTMAKAIRLNQTGGPEVMRWVEVEVGAPGAGEVRLRHEAVGLNFADTYFRTGLYPVPLPNGLGVEAAGVVEAVGEGVTHVAEGDRVTYTGFINTLGAYSTARIRSEERRVGKECRS